MNRLALKDVADLAELAAQARSGQITLLLDGDKPAAFLASGRCSSAELTSALLATRPERPGEVRIERGKLSHQWPAVIRKVRDQNVVVVTEGRVLAGIVRDDGPAVMDTITLGSDSRRERDAAIVAGKEIQLRRWHQVVGRIVPPARIPEFLPGWTLPEPEPAADGVPAPAAAEPKAVRKAPKAKAPTGIEAAERRRLIAEAAERRRAERLAEEAEEGRRRAAGVELGEGRKGPRRAKGLYDEDDEISPAAGSSIDDVLD
jgi:hypothetical protein